MKINNQEIETDDLRELLDRYFRTNQQKLDIDFIEQAEKMISTLSDKTKEKIISNLTITFGTKSSSSNNNDISRLHINDVSKILNEKMALIIYKCLLSLALSKNNYMVTIRTTKYDKEIFELQEYFDVISTLLMYSVNKTSKALSIQKIDTILSGEKANFAKNIRNSITTRLTERKDDNYFRVHNKTDKQIIQIKNLGKYKDIGDKYTNIECPVCGKDLRITKSTITKIIDFNKKNQVVNIICSHEHTDYLKLMPFELHLNGVIEYSEQETTLVPMFVLNNYNRLMNKFSISPKLKKISAKSNIIKLADLTEYLDIDNKYIFIDYPFENKQNENRKKIKITNENLNQIFEINYEQKKVFMNLFNGHTQEKKRIAYIDFKHIVDDTDENSTEKVIAMGVLNNYKLLCLKKFILPTKES